MVFARCCLNAFAVRPRVAMTASAISTSDPEFSAETLSGARGWFHRFAANLIRDERDVPFVRLMVQATLVVVPFAILLFFYFRWALALAYIAVNFLVFVDRYILMLHNTSHRLLFRPRYHVLNLYIPWVLGPFFGESPETYFAHHVGMHHPENNLPPDLSSTMRFERDNVWHFVRYFSRFFFLVLFDLRRYLAFHSRKRLAKKCTFGELSFLALVFALMFVNAKATFVVFVIPFVFVRFMMMAGNWGQHAFIDATQPGNSYVNSITCINTRYNRRCFNDGYHIGHHVKATRHWTEMPGDFRANIARYAQEGSIVFEGIDFFQVWLFLMCKRYDTLAERYVALDGVNRTREEVVLLLRSRTRAIPVPS